MMRLGLCCTFLEESIRFRTTTARYVSSLPNKSRAKFLNELALHNARTLGTAIGWCRDQGIGAFRVQSGLLPLYTHPAHLYELDPEVRETLAAVGKTRGDIRLSFHPDQFVVPGSVNPAVVASSLGELEYQAEVAELIGAEQLTIHGGGAQGGKGAALARLEESLGRLSPRARSRVVLENDDRVYTVEDLLPTCERLGIPLVYDVHHHRCNADSLSIDRATELATATWQGREPWMHLSSPALGWRGSDRRPHADYIDLEDVPEQWRDRNITVDVEAKAKELAVLRLRAQLDGRRTSASRTGRRASVASGRSAPAPRPASNRSKTSARSDPRAAAPVPRAQRTSGQPRKTDRR
jgi:UV DNA damage endonuclease